MDQYSTLWWPRQLTIMTKQHNLWKWALAAAYISTRQTLKQPLGWWTDWPTQLWHNFYDPTSNQMVTTITEGTVSTLLNTSSLLPQDTMLMHVLLQQYHDTSLYRASIGYPLHLQQ
jgi:hypothetical protein